MKDILNKILHEFLRIVANFANAKTIQVRKDLDDLIIKSMTAKEIQLAFIKTYLKPVLKNNGYSTNAQTWWRDRGEFFTVINLQNFSWNSKNDVAFCFNIGIALKTAMKDPISKKATYNDLTINVREDAYLSEFAQTSKYKDDNGYIINDKTKLDDFIRELKFDFEEEILPKLDKLKTIADCVDYYGDFSFWGDYLKRVINEHNL